MSWLGLHLQRFWNGISVFFLWHHPLGRICCFLLANQVSQGSMFVWPKYLRGDAIVSFRQSEKTCEATLWETSGTARGSQMLEIGAQNFFDIPSCADEYSISGGWITLATDGTAKGEAPPWLADHSLRGKFAMWDTQLWFLHPEKLTWNPKVSPFFQRKIFFQTKLYFLGIQEISC